MVKKSDILQIVLGFLLLFTSSCRKVEMKDEKELLVGNWVIKTSCSSIGCSDNGGIYVTISQNGLITKKGGSLNLDEHGRIVKMKKIENPDYSNGPSPMVSYFYKVKIKKESLGDSADELKKIVSIGYSNGYLNSAQVFIPEERLYLCLSLSGNFNSTYSIYVRN